MNYLKITKYIYLVLGFVMLYVTITDWNKEPKPYLSAMLAAVAFFIFFFRGRFQKGFDNRNSPKKP